jgi:hypothetical protein
MTNKPSKLVVLASKSKGVQIDPNLLNREKLVRQYEQEYAEDQARLENKETLYANYDNE